MVIEQNVGIIKKQGSDQLSIICIIKQYDELGKKWQYSIHATLQTLP